MRAQLIVGLMLLASSIGCTGEITVAQASDSYKVNRDYTSLKVIYTALSKGMSRKKVQSLLGEPEYSPTEGQYYYLSDHREQANGNSLSEQKFPAGIVVDYRNQNLELTDSLQDYWMGPIGE